MALTTAVSAFRLAGPLPVVLTRAAGRMAWITNAGNRRRLIASDGTTTAGTAEVLRRLVAAGVGSRGEADANRLTSARAAWMRGTAPSSGTGATSAFTDPFSRAAAERATSHDGQVGLAAAGRPRVSTAETGVQAATAAPCLTVPIDLSTRFRIDGLFSKGPKQVSLISRGFS